MCFKIQSRGDLEVYYHLTIFWQVFSPGELTNMPEAPSASALNTSVPRRTPPSKNTGTRPCAAFTT